MVTKKAERQVDYFHGYCLSTDTKPTGVANGSCIIEMDTGKIYFFDAENGQWREF